MSSGAPIQPKNWKHLEAVRAAALRCSKPGNTYFPSLWLFTEQFIGYLQLLGCHPLAPYRDQRM